jgi:hypothetical protein
VLLLSYRLKSLARLVFELWPVGECYRQRSRAARSAPRRGGERGARDEGGRRAQGVSGVEADDIGGRRLCNT